MSADLRIVAHWTDAPGVGSPDLSATWCRLEVWVGDECTTVVWDAGADLRDGVDGSAYPLAEWVAYQWWPLTVSQRPSAYDASRWTWRRHADESWLIQHNVRAANEGQSWPDLTLVREGEVFCALWSADAARSGDPVRFLTSGKNFLPATQVIAALRAFVGEVLNRLEDKGLAGTTLAREWSRIQASEADIDEAAFCAAAARLGLDPFDVPEEIAEQLPAVATVLGDQLLEDFLDSADPEHLGGALAWLQAARSGLPRRRTTPLGELRATVHDLGPVEAGQPWAAGYRAARSVRERLSAAPTEAFDPAAWVSVGQRQAEPYGLTGYGATRQDDSCALLVPGRLGSVAKRFAAARALGRALLQPVGTEFLLTQTAATHEKVARAFAAELLAPAAGIHDMLTAIGGHDEPAVEAVASRYGVSPWAVKHQLANQT